MLFNISIHSFKRKKENTLVMVASSKSLVEFLVQNGACRGNKIRHGFDMPDWIRDSSIYQKAFVRGLVDTDGCFYTHKHLVRGKLYTSLGFCFCSYSPKLLKSVADVFTANGIPPKLNTKKNCIYLYNKRAQEAYMHTFGSSNPRIYEKYLLGGIA